MATKDRVTIIFNIDEFQTMITKEDFVLLRTDPQNKDQKLIRRIADCIMSTCLKLAKWNIHVVPVFSGTLSLADIGVFPATHYTLHNLPIGPLSLETSQEIVRSALNRDDIPNSLIGTVGGVGRGLQFLVAAIRSQSNKTAYSYRDVFKATVEAIGDMYSIDNYVLSANGVRTLVRLCLSGKEVRKTEAVDGVPLNILEKDGLLFLKPCQPQLFQVVMPLAFAAALNNRMMLFDSNFVTYKPVVKSSDLEKFARDFEVFENNLLLDLGIKETIFGEQFSGALMSDKLKHRPIVLSHMTAYNSKEEQLPKVGPSTTISVVKRHDPVDLHKESVSMWIECNCSTSDNIYTFPGQKNGKTFVCLNELRSTIVWQKAKSAGILADDHTIITTKEQFYDCFSPMFASIALGDDNVHN